MSARQEHRYIKMVIEQGHAITDRQRELEAATMVRNPRPPIESPKPSTKRSQCRCWMMANAQDYECATTLAEGANCALDLPSNALDDETHWVWEEALRAITLADRAS